MNSPKANLNHLLLINSFQVFCKTQLKHQQLITYCQFYTSERTANFFSRKYLQRCVKNSTSVSYHGYSFSRKLLHITCISTTRRVYYTHVCLILTFQYKTCISTVNALEILQSCPGPLFCYPWQIHNVMKWNCNVHMPQTYMLNKCR